jgi:DNA-binding PadR family transcriptional regulator
MKHKAHLAHCRDMKDYITKDMKNGILKIVILSMVKRGNYYPYLLLKDIKKFGPKFIINKDIKNNVYNTLQALENGGYIKAQHIIEDDKSKKYYRITKVGISALDRTRLMMSKAFKEAMKTFDD